MSSPPQSLLDYYSSVEKGSNQRFGQQLSAYAKQAKAQLDMQYKIAKMTAATAAEQLEVDRWYKQQQMALAEKAFGENMRQFDQQFGLNEGELTGFYGGNPTLAMQKYQTDKALAEGQLTGYFGGSPTMSRQQMEAELTGMYNGQQTQAAKQFAQQFGLSEAEVTGTYQGQPTQAAKQFQQQFGLSVAQAAAQLRANPDMIFQYQQFAKSLPGLLAGQGGQAASAVQGQPQGQTIPGQLAEVGYLSAALPGSTAAGAQAGGVNATTNSQAPGSGGPAPSGNVQLGAPPPGALGTAPPEVNDPTLTALGNVYKKGFQALGAQAFEGMDENQLGFTRSAGTYLGYDPKTQFRKYQNSRLGQSVGG